MLPLFYCIIVDNGTQSWVFCSLWASHCIALHRISLLLFPRNTTHALVCMFSLCQPLLTEHHANLHPASISYASAVSATYARRFLPSACAPLCRIKVDCSNATNQNFFDQEKRKPDTLYGKEVEEPFGSVEERDLGVSLCTSDSFKSAPFVPEQS